MLGTKNRSQTSCQTLFKAVSGKYESKVAWATAPILRWVIWKLTTWQHAGSFTFHKIFCTHESSKTNLEKSIFLEIIELSTKAISWIMSEPEENDLYLINIDEFLRRRMQRQQKRKNRCIRTTRTNISKYTVQGEISQFVDGAVGEIPPSLTARVELLLGVWPWTRKSTVQHVHVHTMQ